MDTSTSYLGLQLPHPFVAGASPFGYHLDGVKRLEDAGCAAIVLHSLFEEQITLALDDTVAHMDALESQFAEPIAYFPRPTDYAFTPDAYAEHISRVKQAVRIPVVASLNGRTAEAWLRFARVIEEAGADALELNMYEVFTDLEVQGATVERRLSGIVSELTRLLKIPVAVKLSPFFTALGHVAQQLDRAGASGLVLFNRFYQPDIDIKTMRVGPRLELSTSAELLLRLRWLAILHGRVRPSLAASGGIAVPNDGIKAILAGADVVQMVSALLRHGPAYLRVMRRGLEEWMEWNDMTRLDQMRGRSSLQETRERAAFERANYIRTLQSWRDESHAHTLPN
jgi:dihydroorotate dehydrogenase (fumarate)